MDGETQVPESDRDRSDLERFRMLEDLRNSAHVESRTFNSRNPQDIDAAIKHIYYLLEVIYNERLRQGA